MVRYLRRHRVQLTVAGTALVLAGAILATAAGSSSARSAAKTAAGGPVPTSQLRGKTLVIASWGGSWTAATKKYFGDPFSKATGVKVVYQEEGSGFLAPTLAQEQTGNVQFDLLDGAGTATYGLAVKGDVTPYPGWLKTKLAANSFPGAVHPFFVDYGAGAAVIVCNPALIKKCPTTAKQFWDVQDYPGTRGMIAADPESSIMYALQADGVNRYKVSNWQLTRAFNKLNEIKPHVAVWTESGDQMIQVLHNKTVGMELIWASRLPALKKVMPNVKVSWKNAVTDSEGWVIPKNAPDKDVAFAFLNWFATQAKAQAEWTKAAAAVVPNKKVPSMLTPAEKSSLPAANGTHSVPAVDQWGAVHSTEIAKDWQHFLTGTGA